MTVGRFRQFVAAISGQNGGAGWKPAEGSGKHTHLYSGRGLQDSGSPGLFEPGWDSGDDSSLTSGSLACDPDLATWTSDPVVSVNEKTGEFYYIGLAGIEESHPYCAKAVEAHRAMMAGKKVRVCRHSNEVVDKVE